MINGVEVRAVKKHADERGFFSEVMRADWTDIFPEPLVQVNYSCSYPGVVRAWHRHNQGQVDHFFVISGAIKLCAYDGDKESETYGELDEIILSEENSATVRIPGHLWHGFKAIGNSQTRLIYGVNRLYDYKNPDEERRPWNDPEIAPKTINGKANDPRAGKPWDWDYSPNK